MKWLLSSLIGLGLVGCSHTPNAESEPKRSIAAYSESADVSESNRGRNEVTAIYVNAQTGERCLLDEVVGRTYMSAGKVRKGSLDQQEQKNHVKELTKITQVGINNLKVCDREAQAAGLKIVDNINPQNAMVGPAVAAAYVYVCTLTWLGKQIEGTGNVGKMVNATICQPMNKVNDGLIYIIEKIM